MDTRRVYERNFTHTYNTYLGTVTELRHHLLEFCGDTEKVGTVDFVHLHAFRYNQMLFACGNIRFGVRIYLVFDNRYFGCLHDTAHEEYTGNNQTYFNSDCQIEDNRQEESYQ